MASETGYEKQAIANNKLKRIERDGMLIRRRTLLILIDIILVNLSVVGALALRFDFVLPKVYMDMYINNLLIITVLMLGANYAFNLYNSLWKYASIDEMISILLASFTGSIALYIISIFADSVQFPRSFYPMFALLNVTFIGGSRYTYRTLRRIKNIHIKDYAARSKVLIIGAGKAGSMVIKELYNNPQIKKKPVAFIDDDIKKAWGKIHGVPVVGTREDIGRIVKEKKIDEIIIAMPSSEKRNLKEIIDICKETRCKLMTLPGVYELIDGQVDIKMIRDVDVEDLLGREPVEVNLREICNYIEDRTVLVTGGGGSIGSELCRQIARFEPNKLLIMDIYENNAYEIQNELKHKYVDLDMEVIIASVRDKKRLEQVFNKYRPEIIFHAAAHKHVPLMESNPTEAIKNNVFGTLNVADMADKYGAMRFVLISTDKAVNPTNIMGATKRVAEMIIQAKDKQSNTEYVAVRFGNVLGSNGSVIPLFKKQIARGGPVTVTHPDIIRYFMTIPEAAQLVIQAGAMAMGGEIFVLDMGKPVRIADLAQDLIKLSGFEPNTDIEIIYTGLRPGEKLYEELLMSEEGLKETRHEKIFIGKPIFKDMNQLNKELEMLNNILKEEEPEMIGTVIKKLVPTYRKAI